MPASPNHSSTWAITTEGATGWEPVGAGEGVTDPGRSSDQVTGEELVAEPKVEVGVGVAERERAQAGQRQEDP